MRFLILISIFFSILCSAKGQSNNKSVIKGVIDTIPHTIYFVKYKNQGNTISDTVALDDKSNFKYTAIISEPTIFNISIKNIYNKNYIGDFVIYSFWIEPEKTIEFNGYKGWLINGAKGLIPISNKFDIKNSSLDSIERLFNKNKLTAIKAKTEQLGRNLANNELIEVIRELSDSFISNHPNNYYGLYLISNFPDNTNKQLNDRNNMFKKISNDLQKTYLGESILQKIKISKIFEIGEMMPEFEQTDTISKVVKLSQFRGKYVLVDFWASWCAPCRRENPNLVKAYQKYRGKGFEIIGISLDENKEEWLKAIRNDGLKWTQLSDLKSFKNSVAQQLSIQAVPDNFLIDPNGVILAKGLRGDDLSKELERIFKY
ncbi:TlpA family protein disulfide reductase [Sphingobacterium sp. B29]|uniref:TlpA family protein disulfide reductase n=1 Tax=Sphingobacterium sp. B29 TaxID=1933220 RepID=UPI0009F96E6F|nr:TlpA disulfide reductase family protein [Sphingobacterium sp. B29]